MAKGSGTEAKKIDSYLEHVRSQLTDAYRKLQINKEKITPENIKSLFPGDSDEHTLIELVDYHNTTQASMISPGTLKNYRTTKKYLKRFLKKKFKAANIYLVQVNYKFINDFEYFLRNYQPLEHQKPIGNNGVMKHQERFRKMINSQ